VAGLVPSRRGPKGASKLTPELAARIRELDAAGATLSQIAAAAGVSTFSVRNALGRVGAGGLPAAAAGSAGPDSAGDGGGQGAAVPVLPDPVPRDGERALARWGLLGEGAEPVFTPGARYPLAGLLLALPALEAAGLLAAARQVYGRLKDGYYGLAATLLTLVFLALAGEPRAEGATRVPPGAPGRVLGLDRAPEVKTIRRKLGELAAAGKAAELIMALARHHAAARPQTLGFLHVDGHAWPCQPQLAPPFSFDLAPRSVALGWSSPLIWPPPSGRDCAGSEAGSRIAAGWFAYGRAGRDAVERLAFGAAELAGDLAESVDEGGQGVGAGGFAQVVLGRGGDLGLGAVEVEVVKDGVDVGEQEDQVAGVSGVQADADDLVVAAGLGDQGHGSASWGAAIRSGRTGGGPGRCAAGRSRCRW
jgi:hypothetical protein